jgi:protease-4
MDQPSYPPQPPPPPPWTYAPPPPPPARPASFWIALFLAVLLAGSLFFNVILLFLAAVAAAGGAAAEQERVLMGEGSGDKILCLQIHGEIMEGERYSWTGGRQPDLVGMVRRHLDRARDDPEVKALLLDINSPGGGVTASDLIYEAIQRYKKEKSVPVAAWFRDVAASGGYYVAAAADHIVSHPATLTGSIGVLLQLTNYQGLYEKVGLRDVTIKSSATPFKDIGSPTRPMTDEERRIFQGMVDELYERFVGIVKAGRPKLSEDEVRRAANGAIFSGKQALENGLADQVGYLADAVEFLRQKSGAPKARLVRYKDPKTLLEALTSPGPDAGSASLLDLRRLLPQRAPGVYYLWTGEER